MGPGADQDSGLPQYPRGRAVRGLGRGGRFLKRYKKGFIWGGIGGGFIGILVVGFFLLLPLKLEHLMKNIYGHHFRRVSHSYQVRRNKAVAKYFGDRFNKEGVIIDNTSPFWTQVLRSLHQNGFETKLAERGYKFEYSRPNNPNSRILKITTAQGELRQYDTSTDKKLARAQIRSAAEDITRGESYLKRLRAKRYLTKRTHTKWHWADPVRQPMRKVRITVQNEVFAFILKNQAIQAVTQKLLLDFLGADVAKNYSEKLIAQAASQEVAAKVTAKTLTSAISEVSAGPVGMAIIASQICCALSRAIENESLQKLAQEKAELEYMVFFSKWQSTADQVKSGETDGQVAAANFEMLSSEDGSADMAASNNYRRATGDRVNYQPQDDCKSDKELCLTKQPKHILDKSAVGRVVSSLSSLFNNFEYKLIGSLFALPGSYTGDFLCGTLVKAINEAGGLLGKGVDFVLSRTPVVSEAWSFLKQGAAGLLEKLFDAILKHILPPVVDASTRGPALTNAVAIGADLSANHYQKDQWDGRQLKPEEVAELDRAERDEQRERLARIPVWTRLASLDLPNSLASRLFSMMPSSPRAAAHRTGATLAAALNPQFYLRLATFNLSGLVAAPAHADPGYINPFDVDQYGFTAAELDAPLGDSTLTKLDRDVGCSLVEEFTTPADYPEECLERDETVTSGTPDVTAPTGDAQQLARRILDNPRIEKTGRLVREDLEATAKGAAGTSGKPLSQKLLALLVALGDSYPYRITALESGGTGHSPTSNHYSGHGADLQPTGGSNYDQINLFLYTNRASLSVDELIHNPMPSGTRTLKGGEPLNYGAATMAGHRSHTHVSTK